MVVYTTKEGDNMASKDTLEFIKSFNLKPSEILDILKMPPYHGELTTEIKGDTIFLKGEHFDCNISFLDNSYVIIRRYPDYTCYEFRNNNDEVNKKITEFYIDEERLSIAQTFTDDPEEIIRCMVLAERKGNKVKYKRAVYSYDELNASESYKAMKTEQGTRVHRIVRDDDNVILTTSYNFTEPLYREPVVGQIASTVSVLPPAIVQYFNPVTVPDQMDKVSDYENPVVIVSGTFTDLSSLNSEGEIEKRLGYELLMIKRIEDFQIALTLNESGTKNEYIISCPCLGDVITPDTIDRLIQFLHTTEFLADHSKDFPLEKRILAELINVKRDIIKQTSITEFDVDFLECSLNQPVSYEELAMEFYENLQNYYALVQGEISKDQNKAPSK